jgi:hypothetical protein
MAFNYQPTPTGQAFHESDAAVKMVVGPFGSGKTIICVEDILIYALSQAPAPDGIRYTRVGVIRSSYPELTSTTRNSLLEVLDGFPGSITSAVAPLKGFYKIPLPDGTTAQIELVLQALQTAEDADKIRSANWSFAWINEATGVDSAIFNQVLGRIGRFPSADMGGCSWAGVLMDFNQPQQGSWLDTYIKNPESDWDVFRQPPAAFKDESELGEISYRVNPEAENLRNLGMKKELDNLDSMTYEERGMAYYGRQIKGWQKSGRLDIIDSWFCMLDVPMQDGKPVFPQFAYDKHVSRNPVAPQIFQPTVVGFDTSGIHPAAAIFQMQAGKWCVLDELYGEELGLVAFIQQLLVPLMTTKYANCPVVVSCDPANARDGAFAKTPVQYLQEAGFKAVTPRVNDIRVRIRAVEQLLNVDAGGLMVSKDCLLTIRAFSGEYHYKKLRVFGSIDVAYDPTPQKNTASHLADAIQYAALHIVNGERVEDEKFSAAFDNAIQHRNRVRRVV